MNFPLDQIAIVGYSLILVFSIMQLPKMKKNSVDLVANILLIVGLSALITYHVRKLSDKVDETTSVAQKATRAVAHSSLVAFLCITLSAASSSIFRLYDTFALAAHVILLVTVLNGTNQIAGVGLLAAYFLFASYHTLSNNPAPADFILFAGRLLMLVFFTVAFISGVSAKQ